MVKKPGPEVIQTDEGRIRTGEGTVRAGQNFHRCLIL